MTAAVFGNGRTVDTKMEGGRKEEGVRLVAEKVTRGRRRDGGVSLMVLVFRGRRETERRFGSWLCREEKGRGC